MIGVGLFVRIYHWAHGAGGGAPTGASGEVLAPENVPCVLLLSRGLGTGSAFLQTWHLGTKPVSVPRPSLRHPALTCLAWDKPGVAGGRSSPWDVQGTTCPRRAGALL